MKKVAKVHLRQAVEQKLQVSSAVANELVDVYFQTIAQALVTETKVSLYGLGVFEKHYKDSRFIQSISSKKATKIAPRMIVKFKTGAKLRHAIQANSEQILKGIKSNPLNHV